MYSCRCCSPLHVLLRSLASVSSAATASSSRAVGRGHCSGKARCSQRLRQLPPSFMVNKPTVHGLIARVHSVDHDVDHICLGLKSPVLHLQRISTIDKPVPECGAVPNHHTTGISSTAQLWHRWGVQFRCQVLHLGAKRNTMLGDVGFLETCVYIILMLW